MLLCHAERSVNIAADVQQRLRGTHLFNNVDLFNFSSDALSLDTFKVGC